MIVIGLALAGCAGGLGLLAGPVLARGRWAEHHPGAAIACWLGAIAGTVIALSGLVVLVTLAPPGPGHGLLEWLFSCLPHHGHGELVTGALVALLAATACYAGLLRGIPRRRQAAHRARSHRELLRMVAREDPRHGDVMIIDHPAPVAYSLPARTRPIVLSTGVLDRLEDREVAAVLAHERVHLRQRHHLVLAAVDLAGAMLPWLPTLRMARRHVPPLLEMAADDAAVRHWGRTALTGALRGLDLAGAPTAADHRITRLHTAPAAVRGVPALALTLSTVAIVGPLAVAVLAAARIPWPC